MSNTTPNLSPHLESAIQRLADRQTLIRKDVDMLLDGLRVKSRIVEGLTKRIHDHRQDDAEQLTLFQEEAASRWEERLRRLRQWVNESEELGRTSGRAEAWRKASNFFTRAQDLSARYAPRLQAQADGLQKKLGILQTALGGWTDRLILEENELQEFVERQAKKGTEVLVSSARKRPHQEFVFTEREKEAEIARIFRSVRQSINHVLARLERLEIWFEAEAAVQPAYFEIQKKQLIDFWKPLHLRFTQLKNQTLEQALTFEEGRQRLRKLYEIVQKMRVVQEMHHPAEEKKKKPLFQRLFNINDN